MRLFLDASVLLAATGSTAGASRALFDLSGGKDWTLVTSHYCLAETTRNLPKFDHVATTAWDAMRSQKLTIVRDAVVLDRPLLFSKVKDKPVLLSALADRCDVLLTLDRRDFGPFLDRQIYGMWIRTPGSFLEHERDQEGDET